MILLAKISLIKSFDVAISCQRLALNHNTLAALSPHVGGASGKAPLELSVAIQPPALNDIFNGSKINYML